MGKFTRPDLSIRPHSLIMTNFTAFVLLCCIASVKGAGDNWSIAPTDLATVDTADLHYEGGLGDSLRGIHQQNSVGYQTFVPDDDTVTSHTNSASEGCVPGTPDPEPSVDELGNTFSWKMGTVLLVAEASAVGSVGLLSDWPHVLYPAWKFFLGFGLGCLALVCLTYLLGLPPWSRPWCQRAE